MLALTATAPQHRMGMQQSKMISLFALQNSVVVMAGQTADLQTATHFFPRRAAKLTSFSAIKSKSSGPGVDFISSPRGNSSICRSS